MSNNKQAAICIPKQMLSSFTDLVFFKQNRKCMQSVTCHIHSVIVITVHNLKEKNENVSFPCQRYFATS